MDIMRFVVYLLAAMASCRPSDSSNLQHLLWPEEKEAKYPLVELLHDLPPWRASRELTEQEWETYIRTARIFQQSDPNAVSEALRIFMRQVLQGDSTDLDFSAESKPFILMRVMFELPDTPPTGQVRSYMGWISFTDRHRGWSWPVQWTGSKPRLRSLCVGSAGPPYAASQEYEFFMKTFPFRDLGEP